MQSDALWLWRFWGEPCWKINISLTFKSMLPVGKKKKIYFKSCHSYFLLVPILPLWCFFSFIKKQPDRLENTTHFWLVNITVLTVYTWFPTLVWPRRQKETKGTALLLLNWSSACSAWAMGVSIHFTGTYNCFSNLWLELH